MINNDNILDYSSAKLIQPLTLAMIGDAVQTLYVRTHIALKYKVKVNKINKLVSSVVSAGAQFNTFKKIETKLNDDEQDIAKRARNTHKNSKAKNFSYGEYIYATALEAVIGYLYLTNQNERLDEILTISLEELKLDYQDYLRQHGEKIWQKDEFLYVEFVKRRISCKKEFREFIVWAENYTSVQIRTVPYKSVLVANAVLLLIDTASYFLKRQIEKKAAIFLDNGGFAERMHNMRIQKRKDG